MLQHATQLGKAHPVQVEKHVAIRELFVPWRSDNNWPQLPQIMIVDVDVLNDRVVDRPTVYELNGERVAPHGIDALDVAPRDLRAGAQLLQIRCLEDGELRQADELLEVLLQYAVTDHQRLSLEIDKVVERLPQMSIVDKLDVEWLDCGGCFFYAGLFPIR